MDRNATVGEFRVVLRFVEKRRNGRRVFVFSVVFGAKRTIFAETAARPLENGAFRVK
jgi:hypothetical protein